MENLSFPQRSVIAVISIFLATAFFTCNNGTIEPELLTGDYVYSSVSIAGNDYVIDSGIAMSNGTKEKILSILEKENLKEKKTVAEIPVFIKAFLDNISANKNFDIANSGEKWQDSEWIYGFDTNTKSTEKATTYIAEPFPTRQLIYCGVGKSTAMLSYYTGGIRMSQHVMILKFEGKKIVDLWLDNNSYGCDSGVKSGTKKDGLIKYVKSMKNNNC